jgi:hypothetical protein
MSKNSSGATAQATKPMQTTKPQSAPAPTKMSVPTDKVSKLAYEKWLKGGCKHGCDQQHWYEAEMELRGAR